MKERDEAYMRAAEAGDLEACRRMVREAAEEAGALDSLLPEEAEGYAVRTRPAPERTVRACKIFYVDGQGRPSALFAGGCNVLPEGVWIDAKEQWSFKAPNGRRYVPGGRNPSRTTPDGKRKNRTGGSEVKIWQDKALQKELAERGIVSSPDARGVSALAYRPGWHAGVLPYFPQGGTARKDSAYGNVHEWNQVVYEVELSADRDWTSWARSQDKARAKDGSLKYGSADLDFMPEDGFYRYATNPKLDPEKEAWMIAASMRIVRPLTQEECDERMLAAGMRPQEWEQGRMRLEDLHVKEGPCAPSPTLAPVAYGEGGRIVPLSERFAAFREKSAPDEGEEEWSSPAP